MAENETATHLPPPTQAKENPPVGLGQQRAEYFADSLNTDKVPKFRPPQFLETIAGLLVLVAWACCFGSGILVATSSYRRIIWETGATSFLEWLKAAAIVFFCYTVTNLFFLSCISAYLGCMAARWHVESSSNEDFYSGVSPRRMYVSAVLRGFLLYLLVTSGTLIVANDAAITSTSAVQYVRLAGLVSSLAFVVGFDPRLIYLFLKKVTDILTGTPRHGKS